MSTFNLNYLVDKHHVDMDALAKELFPTNKFPRFALNRILEGVAYLDTAQLDIVARVCNVQVSELFMSESWSSKISDNKVVFYKNNFRAELDLDTFITEIFYKDKIVATETIIVEHGIKLSDYLKLVDNVIINLI